MQNEQIKKIINHYITDESYDIQVGNSGMNNLTRYIVTNTQKYVLRVYQNHEDIETVRNEHHILLQLAKQNMTFATPKLVKTNVDSTVVKLEDGKLASLFYYIEGTNLRLSTLNQYEDYGDSVGKLTHYLSQLEVLPTGTYVPYYEINKSYPTCPLEIAISFCLHPDASFKDDILALQKVAFVLKDYHEVQEKMKLLPHQPIHGDINSSNILMNEEKEICAILDFEFVTCDLRAMELAICLSEIMHDVTNQRMEEHTIFQKLESFITGYRQQVKLTSLEIEMIPKLILLRRVDVFIHFLNRYFQKIETENVDPVVFLKKQINAIVEQAHWLDVNQNKLIEYFKELKSLT